MYNLLLYDYPATQEQRCFFIFSYTDPQQVRMQTFYMGLASFNLSLLAWSCIQTLSVYVSFRHSFFYLCVKSEDPLSQKY